MSRLETARDLVSSRLGERISEIDLAEMDEARAQIRFVLSYYGDSDHTMISKALETEGFGIINWVVNGSYEGGVIVTLSITDVQTLLTIGLDYEFIVGAWKGEGCRERYLTIPEAQRLVQETEKTDPEGAELLKRKLLTGVVEGS